MINQDSGSSMSSHKNIIVCSVAHDLAFHGFFGSGCLFGVDPVSSFNLGSILAECDLVSVFIMSVESRSGPKGEWRLL